MLWKWFVKAATKGYKKNKNLKRYLLLNWQTVDEIMIKMVFL